MNCFNEIRNPLKFLLRCLMLALLSSGCATTPEVPASVPASKAATENSSKLLMRSIGMPMNVEYSVGPSDLPCKELEPVGTVRDKGKNVLLPWIVKLTEKLNRVPEQIETQVPPEQSIQVSGYGRWFDSNSKGRCGPVIVSFLPAQRHTYLVEFVWQGTSQCTSQVFDVTDPSERVAVPTQFKSCPRSFIDIWLGR